MGIGSPAAVAESRGPDIAVSAPATGAADSVPVVDSAESGSCPMFLVESSQTYIAPVGVLDTEEPVLEVEHPEESGYKGVRIPLDLARALLSVNARALKGMEGAGAQWRATLFGGNRLFAHTRGDVDRMRNILTGQGSPEDVKYLEKLLELERIRAAIIMAIAEILELDAFDGMVERSGFRMREEEQMRDKVLQTAAELADDLAKPPEGQTMVRIFGSTRPIGEALGMALPSSYRPKKEEQKPDEAQLAYLAGEMATKKDILDRGGSIVIHEGSDVVSAGIDGEDKSITEVLREVILRYYKMAPIMSGRWIVDESLDGIAFEPHRGGAQLRSRRAPYYMPDGRSSSGANLAMVPLVPWDKDFMHRAIREEHGPGIAAGQSELALRFGISPVLAAHLIASAGKDSLGGGAILAAAIESIGSSTYDNVMGWALDVKNDPGSAPKMPKDLTLEGFETLLGTLCKSIGSRAKDLLEKKS